MPEEQLVYELYYALKLNKAGAQFWPADTFVAFALFSICLPFLI